MEHNTRRLVLTDSDYQAITKALRDYCAAPTVGIGSIATKRRVRELLSEWADILPLTPPADAKAGDIAR